MIQLLAEARKLSPPIAEEFARLGRVDNSAVVRLYLAAALQRIPTDQREPILNGLLAHSEDAQDQNLPLMYWYALAPVVSEHLGNGADFLKKTKIPVLRRFIARRLASNTPP